MAMAFSHFLQIESAGETLICPLVSLIDQNNLITLVEKSIQQLACFGSKFDYCNIVEQLVESKANCKDVH